MSSIWSVVSKVWAPYRYLALKKDSLGWFPTSVIYLSITDNFQQRANKNVSLCLTFPTPSLMRGEHPERAVMQRKTVNSEGHIHLSPMVRTNLLGPSKETVVHGHSPPVRPVVALVSPASGVLNISFEFRSLIKSP